MPFDLANTLQLLERTPAILAVWLRGLPPTWTQSNEGPGTWSAFDIVGHLTLGEQTDWIPRTRRILTGGDAAVFEPFDRAGHEVASVGKSIETLLDEFATARSKSLADLRILDLQPEQLRLCGVHPEFGSVRLDELLAAWTAHDLAHLAQIARAMARRYQGAVGPWERYLPIVRPR